MGWAVCVLESDDRKWRVREEGDATWVGADHTAGECRLQEHHLQEPFYLHITQQLVMGTYLPAVCSAS